MNGTIGHSGGGGGYSGGGGGSDATSGGGGGGSYITGTQLVARTGATDGNSGNGLIIISYLVYPIRYVKQNGQGDGTSWDDASGDLQSQIDALGVQQVWVAGGVYSTTANNGSFVMKTNVAIYGGFSATNPENSLQQRPAVNPVTGTPSSTTLTVNNNNRVISNESLDQTAILDGVVITGGRGGFSGGGISNRGSSPTLTNCLITGNAAQNGGGIFNFDRSNPTLTNCVISGNTASARGGGIYNDGNLNLSSNPSLTNCVISSNTATSGGGIANLAGSSPSLTNCLLLANQANQGGGITGNGKWNLVNCTLTANRAGEGAALRTTTNGQAVFTNTILYDNQESTGTAISAGLGSITANYCLIGVGETNFTGSNNLTATSSPFAGATDYRLASGSAAIDQGNYASYQAANGPSTDLGGNPRLANNRIDIGAYEYQGPFCPPIAISALSQSATAVCANTAVNFTYSFTAGPGSYTIAAYRDNTYLNEVGSGSGTDVVSGQGYAFIRITQSGSYQLVITSGCASATTTYAPITVNALPTASLTNNGPLSCTQTSVTLTASGGSSYTFTSSSGTIGTPGSASTVQVSSPGTYSVTVANSSGCLSSTTTTVGSTTATITVNNPAVTTAYQGVPFSQTFTASGGQNPYSFSVTSGSLPTGLTLVSAGVLSGTPTQSGSFPITVRATDANGCSGVSSSYTLVVNQPVLIRGTKTVTGMFTPGSTITYTILLTNNSTTSAQADNPGNELTDVLPSSLNLTGATASAGGVATSGNTVTWNGAIPASGSVTITITAIIKANTATQTVSNQATISYDADTNGTNESTAPTDDPSVGGTSDPTTFVVVCPSISAPNLVTQAGHPYPAGVSSLTASQNTGDVVLEVSGCSDGTNSWAGGNSSTLALSTANTGTQTYTATCTSNGCTSPAAFFQLTVVPPTLTVSHLDATSGQFNTNTIKPFLQLNNVGGNSIAYNTVTVRYYLTVEGASPITNFQTYYVQIGAANVQIRYVPLAPARQGANAYIEYSFSAGAGSLSPMSNSGPIQNGFLKADYSAFNQADDYSFATNRDYTLNPRITAYINGQIVYGTEPAVLGSGPQMPLTVNLTATTQVFSTSDNTTLVAQTAGGSGVYSYAFSGPGTITPNGNTAVASGQSAGVKTFTVVVTDTSTPTAMQATATVSVTVTGPPNTPPVATANANQTATVGTQFTYTVQAFTDNETPSSLTYSASISPTNGFSFDPATRMISGTPSQTGVSSVTITATDPGGLSAFTSFTITVKPAPVMGSGQLTVSHLDATYGQLNTNTIKPYLQLANTGQTAIPYSSIKLRYYLTKDGSSPITNFEIYYVQLGAQNVRVRYVALASPVVGADAYIEYSFDGAAGSLAPGASSGPIQTGFLKQDYSAFDQSNDYSYALNRDYALNTRITGYVNNQLVFGTPPSGAPARVASSEPVSGQMSVRVLGNPIVGQSAQVEISGAKGQRVNLSLTDLQGRSVHQQQIEQAGAIERVNVPVSGGSGLFLLQVATPTQRQQIKLIKN